MNKRRLSYGLLVTIAAAGLIAVGCDTPPAEAPPQASGAPSAEPAPATSAAVEAPPPAVSAAPAEAPPPPAKPAKDKFVGKFVQDFSGEVKETADAAAKKAAGKKDADNKKYNAAMDKAGAAVATNTLENTGDTFVWKVKDKAAHTVGYTVSSKADDPANLTIKLGKDGKKDLKGVEVAITFSDDNTFSMKDPFSKKPATLVFKRQ
jgi:plastocyanin